MGKFEKGNKLAKGGARKGAGRVSKDRASELDLVLALKRGTLEEVPPLVKLAAETLKEAMGSRGEFGEVTGPAVAAAKLIWESRFGKAPATLDITSNSGPVRVVVEWDKSGGPFGAPTAASGANGGKK